MLVRTAVRTPEDPANFQEQPRFQPYYKLHGSTNWMGGGGDGGRLIIMGGNKSEEISQYPLLDWYHRQFRNYLSRAARLMIIGYSFSDAHINRAIIDAAKRRNIGIFIVDPAGVDVLNKQDPRHLQAPSELMEALHPRIIGASRRPFFVRGALVGIGHAPRLIGVQSALRDPIPRCEYSKGFCRFWALRGAAKGRFAAGRAGSGALVDDAARSHTERLMLLLQRPSVGYA
jgi:SIR2-like domain